MTWTLRLPAVLLERVRRDLARPHAFAQERIGFVLGRSAGGLHGSTILLGSDYIPIPDPEYVDDPTVGARIGSAAIRRGMQAVLDGGVSCLHTHMHYGRGVPQFSRVDGRELPPVVRGFMNVRHDVPHGALLLSEDSLICALWLPGSERPTPGGKVVVVGRPMRFEQGVDLEG